MVSTPLWLNGAKDEVTSNLCLTLSFLSSEFIETGKNFLWRRSDVAIDRVPLIASCFFLSLFSLTDADALSHLNKIRLNCAKDKETSKSVLYTFLLILLVSEKKIIWNRMTVSVLKQEQATKTQLKQDMFSLSYFSLFLSIYLLFKCHFMAWQMTKGISLKICILCVRVKINKRLFEPFCVWN